MFETILTIAFIGFVIWGIIDVAVRYGREKERREQRIAALIRQIPIEPDPQRKAALEMELRHLTRD